MEENKPPGEQPRHAHEKKDVDIFKLAMFGIGLALLVIAGLGLSYAVLRYFFSHQSLGPPATPFETHRELPPEPHLQVAAPVDLKQYKAVQDSILNSYGWVNQKAGIVRIPIDRAMDILLQRGLPVRGAAPAKPSGGKAEGTPLKTSALLEGVAE